MPLTIDPPAIPDLPQLEDGSPINRRVPNNFNRRIEVPDNDGDGFWRAVEDAQPGTLIEIAGDLSRPQFKWPNHKSRGLGWVVVQPKPAIMAQLDRAIGTRRITEADYGLLPKLHATQLLGEVGFQFGHARNTDANIGPDRAESRNLWFNRICFNLNFDADHNNNGMELNADGLSFTQCLCCRHPFEQALRDFRGGWILADGYDLLFDGCTVTGCAQPQGSESQTLLTFSRATRLWSHNTHWDQAAQSVMLYDTNHVIGKGKTTEHVTFTNSVLGDPYGKYTTGAFADRWNFGKAVFEIKSCKCFRMDGCLVGPQRGIANGGQIARLTVYRFSGMGNSGINSAASNWTIENNLFGPSPGEFALFLLISGVENGTTPDGAHRIRIADNVFRNISSNGTEQLQIFLARWGQNQGPNNDSKDIEIARNIAWYENGPPRGFARIHGGGTFDISQNKLPGPLSIHDNIVQCGGSPALRSVDFTPSVGHGSVAMRQGVERSEWEYNAHVNAASTPETATNVWIPDLSSVNFEGANADDYRLKETSRCRGAGSEGSDIGLSDPVKWKDRIDHTREGQAEEIEPPPPLPPPENNLEPRISALEQQVTGLNEQLRQFETTHDAYNLRIGEIETALQYAAIRLRDIAGRIE